jgi:hypothetical protein
MNKEINLKFEWANPKSEESGKPVLGIYEKDIRTITIFLGSFKESYCTKLSIIEYFGKLKLFCNGSAKNFIEKQVLKLDEEWFNDFPETIQEEFLHACIEDIRGKVEKKKEEWIIDRIEEMLRN